MNTNLFHNIANVASLALAGTTAMLLTSGCSQNADSMFDCAHSGIKFVVNILRDGLTDWSSNNRRCTEFRANP